MRLKLDENLGRRGALRLREAGHDVATQYTSPSAKGQAVDSQAFDITGGGPVMAIFAHPDDPEFVAGGALARWADAGRQLVYVICTDGSKGAGDPAVQGRDLVQRRQEEQRAAAAALGCRDVVFLPYEDAMLEPTLALRRDLTRQLRRYQPQTVVCFDPTPFWVGDFYLQHPDHRASGEAALAAIFPAARDRLTFPELLAEGLEPHIVEEIFLGSPREPNRWLDITAVMQRKIDAMLHHQSQAPDAGRIGDLLRALARDAGAAHGLAFAEAYRYISLNPQARLGRGAATTHGREPA